MTTKRQRTRRPTDPEQAARQDTLAHLEAGDVSETVALRELAALIGAERRRQGVGHPLAPAPDRAGRPDADSWTIGAEN